MRTIETTTRFRRDLKRERKGRHAKRLNELIETVVDLLAADATLPDRYNDHSLSGDWTDFRDCHVLPDLVLIYRKPNADVLELVRLGSHSELGL